MISILPPEVLALLGSSPRTAPEHPPDVGRVDLMPAAAGGPVEGYGHAAEAPRPSLDRRRSRHGKCHLRVSLLIHSRWGRSVF